jgi:hypothetical protein
MAVCFWVVFGLRVSFFPCCFCGDEYFMGECGGVAWRGVAWRGVALRGVALRGVAWRG